MKAATDVRLPLFALRRLCRWGSVLIALCLLTATAWSQSASTEIPRSVQRKLLRDAARLTLRLAAQQEDLRFQRISIPRQPMMEIYEVLAAIYRADERARTLERCNVHTFPNPSIERCVVIFERDASWAAPLREGITETNSPEINQLLDEYDLIIEKHVQWNDRHDAMTIRSTEPLNMAALANEFYNVEGVMEVDLGIPDVSGSDIELRRLPDGWEVKFVLRFGSLFNDKGQSHIWVWKVSDNKQVQFVTEEGAPIPSWMRCQFDQGELLVRSY